MSIENQEPGKGRRRGKAPWTYLKVPCGTYAEGFLAGKPLGLHCHTVNKLSKPCRSVATRGELTCPHCAKGEPVWRGFTPFYDRDYQWRFIVIVEEYLEAVNEIERFTQIKIRRGKAATDCVVVRAENWRTLAIPASDSRQSIPDLLPSLLILWEDVELSAWHYSRPATAATAPAEGRAASDTPVSPEREKELMGGLIRSRLHWPGKDEPGAPGPQLLGDVIDQVPSANGKRKPK